MKDIPNIWQAIAVPSLVQPRNTSGAGAARSHDGCAASLIRLRVIIPCVSSYTRCTQQRRIWSAKGRKETAGIADTSGDAISRQARSQQMMRTTLRLLTSHKRSSYPSFQAPVHSQVTQNNEYMRCWIVFGALIVQGRNEENTAGVDITISNRRRPTNVGRGQSSSHISNSTCFLDKGFGIQNPASVRARKKNKNSRN